MSSVKKLMDKDDDKDCSKHVVRDILAKGGGNMKTSKAKSKPNGKETK